MKRADMTFFGHVAELRKRIIHIVAALCLTSGASLAFAPSLLQFLVTPYGDKLKVIGPTESVAMYLRIALTCGAIIAMPCILFEIWRFIAPALHPRERRYAYTAIPSAVVLFFTGASFAWFVMIPVAVRFLAGFMPAVFKIEWTSERYYPFVTSLLFWVGVCFELPLVVFLLAKLRLLTARLLLRGWRIALVLIVTASALITPTVDAFNMLIVALPLVGLYVVSILLAAIAQRDGQAAR